MRVSNIKISKDLRSLGFDWSCTNYYDECTGEIGNSTYGNTSFNYLCNGEFDNLLAVPYIDQALDWIKRYYDIDILPGIDEYKMKYVVSIYKCMKLSESINIEFTSVDDALQYGLDKVLDKIKSGKYEKTM